MTFSILQKTKHGLVSMHINLWPTQITKWANLLTSFNIYLKVVVSNCILIIQMSKVSKNTTTRNFLNSMKSMSIHEFPFCKLYDIIFYLYVTLLQNIICANHFILFYHHLLLLVMWGSLNVKNIIISKYFLSYA